MSLIIIIFVSIIAIAIISFILKSVIKVALVVGLIYLLFHIGFVWGGDEIKEKLQIDKWLDKETSQKFEENYSDFSEKRENVSVIDTDKLKTTVEIQLQNALLEASNKIELIDKEKLLINVSETLKKSDTETINSVLNDLQSTLTKYNLTEKEIENAISQQQ